MEKTPLAFRTHISIFGNTNAGKSSLFNAIIGQDMAVVSDKKGTTTDPVTKAMELIPYGPVAITDTAGMGDLSEIGDKRMEKTKKILNSTDFAIYAADYQDFDPTAYEAMKVEFEKRKISHMLVFTKCDDADFHSEKYPDTISVSVNKPQTIERLLSLIQEKLSTLKGEDVTMIGSLLPKGSTVVMVVPIDSEAPKGRLILPQVQFLRDCLDHGMKTLVVRDTELEEALLEVKADLVVTDSQIFAQVNKIVPENIMLTSFSMMMASMKCDLKILSEGASAIESLTDNSRILMAEACTHNVSHEDIGRKKIPALLKKYTGKNLVFDYYVHQDFPENITDYDLVIHCGGCMLNSRSFCNRMSFCKENGVPITNYGVVLAYVNGILERSKKVFGI